MSTVTYSQYQMDAFDWIARNVLNKTGKHLRLDGVAGCGKTFFLTETSSMLGGIDWMMVAFNSSIAKELKTRLPGAYIKTYHGLGLDAIRRTYGNVKVDEHGTKLDGVLRPYLGTNEKWMTGAIRRLVSMCKNLLYFDPSEELLYSIALEYDIDLYDDNSTWARDKIFQLTQMAIIKSLEITNIVDFDDMPSMPIFDDKISPHQYEALGIDEVQDTNAAQLWLALNSVSADGSIFGVGDTNQSIYAFRGADSTAMDKFQEKLDAERLPLSLCYRCPTSVRDLVNAEFPEIKFETPDWAIEGKVENIESSKVEETTQEDDLILCRINADLVPLAFKLIRRGMKATIKGRSIGDSLVTLIKKQKADDPIDLFSKLDAFREKQAAKFIALNKYHKITELDDRLDTIDAIAEGADTIAEIVTRCQTLFSDERKGVLLSSIHKAKGLEANNVKILRPDLLPHPRAKTPVQIQQEKNLRYVAVTRAKQTLSFVV